MTMDLQHYLKQILGSKYPHTKQGFEDFLHSHYGISYLEITRLLSGNIIHQYIGLKEVLNLQIGSGWIASFSIFEMAVIFHYIEEYDAKTRNRV